MRNDDRRSINSVEDPHTRQAERVELRGVLADRVGVDDRVRRVTLYEIPNEGGIGSTRSLHGYDRGACRERK